MTNPGVWAPRAKSVMLLAGKKQWPMRQSESGWWSLDDPTLPPGTEYWFVVDGGSPAPDPRSPWQPEGVHGPSSTVDHAAFDWSDDGWRAPPFGSAVVYELHVGTFTPAGTFDGVLPKLDHLLDLGVTHVEVMPVNQFPGSRGWGYDGVGLFAPHNSYGGPDGLKRLVDGCHSRGLGVLLDVVYNHLGPDGNYLGRFGPYFTEAYGTPWGPALNLDQAHSDEVRRFILDNAHMWFRDYHVDGLRLDAVHAFFDRSARHLLEQLAEETAALEVELGRPLTLVAESDLNDPRIVTDRAAGGYGVHAQWSDDFHHALHAVVTGERAGYYEDFGSLEHVARALREGYVFTGQYSVHRRRSHGRIALGVPPSRLLGYLQTHDQVGNRARGERISHLAAVGRVQVAVALVLCSPFVPLLFQGEEWAASTPFCYFTDHENPELGRAVSRGRKSEFAAFGWQPDEIPDPQDIETFRRSCLLWDELDQPEHRQMHAWYRSLLSLRRSRPEVLRPPTAVRYDESAGWLQVERPGTWIVANFGRETYRCSLPPRARLLLTSGNAVLQHLGELVVPVDSVGIVALSKT